MSENTIEEGNVQDTDGQTERPDLAVELEGTDAEASGDENDIADLELEGDEPESGAEPTEPTEPRQVHVSHGVADLIEAMDLGDMTPYGVCQLLNALFRKMDVRDGDGNVKVLQPQSFYNLAARGKDGKGPWAGQIYEGQATARGAKLMVRAEGVAEYVIAQLEGRTTSVGGGRVNYDALADKVAEQLGV